MHILTFDIEDWFLARKAGAVPSESWSNFESRVERNTESILELLDGHNQKATFFILGWIAQKYPALIRKIDASGHETGFHSNLHEHLWMMKPDQLANDFKDGLSAVENVIGKKVLFYRAPYFSFRGNSGWAFDIIQKNGFVATSSTLAYSKLENLVVPDKPFLLEKNGLTLYEFPLNRLNFPFVKPIFTGSGYFRTIPYPVLKKLFEESSYTNTYFHPRDFDKATPYSGQLSVARNFLNKIGSGTTMDKLEKIFAHLNFISLGDALKIIKKEKNEIPVLKL